MKELIRRKRDGEALTPEEIERLDAALEVEFIREGRR